MDYRKVAGDIIEKVLYTHVAAACESEFSCVDAIEEYTCKETSSRMTCQEKLYLAVHINRIRNS